MSDISEQDPMQLAEHYMGTAETGCAESCKRRGVVCVSPCYPERDPNPLRKLMYYSNDRIVAGFTATDDPRGYVALLVTVGYRSCHYQLRVWDDEQGCYKFVSSLLADRATAEKACIDYLEATLWRPHCD